jgi:hypothetical protein
MDLGSEYPDSLTFIILIAQSAQTSRDNRNINYRLEGFSAAFDIIIKKALYLLSVLCYIMNSSQKSAPVLGHRKEGLPWPAFLHQTPKRRCSEQRIRLPLRGEKPVRVAKEEL